MPESRHILGAFEGAITALMSDVRRMGTLALQNLHNAAEGLLTRDSDLCNRAIADDEEVDLLEKKIDRQGIQIIMRYSPVARDLRRVISSMKASTAIERISDHAISLAKRARKLNERTAIPETDGIRELFDLAASELEDSVAAFCDGNLEAALRLQTRDAALDNAHAAFTQRVIARLEEDATHVNDYVDLLFITRFLERIGDQSVNIAEDAVYLLTAMDIRHGGELPELGQRIA